MSSKKHPKYKPFHTLVDPDEKDFSSEQIIQIQVIYIIAAIIWLIIIYWLHLYTGSIIVWVFIFIPLIVYGLNFHWAPQHTEDVPCLMFNADFLAIGFLILTIVINWCKNIDIRQVLPVIILAIIILAFTLIDIWTSKSNFILVQHIRSALETAAVVLLMVVAYKYYVLVMSTDECIV